jgi:hypothetical protein
MFNFLKSKNKNIPSLKSLRPLLFDINFFWFLSLVLCSLVLVITFTIGFKLFYSQYFESYKQSSPTENIENIMKIDNLKNAIEQRNEFINQEISLPRDPSV